MRLVLFMVMILMSGCSDVPRERTAVFDLHHSEAFQPIDIQTLGFTTFYGMFEAGGFETYAISDPITAGSLDGVGVLVLAGPLIPLSPEENDAILGFVDRGGGLLVLLHIAPPVSPLLNGFGVMTTSGPISESENTIGGNPKDFYAYGIEDGHPITKGVERVALYGSWGLGSAHTDARLVARTTPNAWIDFNGDGYYQGGEFMDTYGVVAVREYGKGKVVVIGDDAPLTDRFLAEGNNRRLAENTISWFKDQGKTRNH